MDTYKVEHSAGTELRLDRAGQEDGGFAALHAELGLAVFDDIELNSDDAGDLDGATEGDLTVTLREMQVTDGELAALDVHGKVHLAASAQVLDVAWTRL